MTNFNIKNATDITLGAVVTSKQGKKYVVLADDTHQRGFFTAQGTWIRPSDTSMTFGKNGMEIAKVQVFDTLPTLDAISEGIKHVITGRQPSAVLKTVWTSEDPAVTAAKAELADIEKRKQQLNNFLRNA